jgi:hypothetical protein
MKIRARFYYHNKGKFFDYGGYMVLTNRSIERLGSIPIEDEGRPFYYDDTSFSITCENKNKKYLIEINRIITESSYKTTQKEYLIKLNWLQKQKLIWMFRRHWLQQPGNVIHLVVAMLIISMAFLGFEFITH